MAQDFWASQDGGLSWRCMSQAGGVRIRCRCLPEKITSEPTGVAENAKLLKSGWRFKVCVCVFLSKKFKIVSYVPKDSTAHHLKYELFVCQSLFITCDGGYVYLQWQISTLPTSPCLALLACISCEATNSFEVHKRLTTDIQWKGILSNWRNLILAGNQAMWYFALEYIYRSFIYHVFKCMSSPVHACVILTWQFGQTYYTCKIRVCWWIDRCTLWE